MSDDALEGLFDHRLPATTALEGSELLLREGDASISLRLQDGVAVWQARDGTAGADRYDAVEVAPDTFFVDIWRRSHDDREALTAVVNRATGHAIVATSTVQDKSHRPRVRQRLAPAVLVRPGRAPLGPPPDETRDLIGLRVIAEYSAEIVFEQIYVNSQRMSWQCLRGDAPGSGGCDEATYWRFGPSRYVFGFSESAIDAGSVFFVDLERLRSTGKYLEVDGDGRVHNGAVGARLALLSRADYPESFRPV